MQGPTASGTDINQPASLNHVQSAAETRLSDYIGSTSETACLHATNADVQRLSDWNTWESSSTLDLPNQLNDDGLKTEHGWSSSLSAPTEGPEERQLKPDTVIFPFNPDLSLHGNQSSTQPYPLLGSSSTSNLNMNIGHIAYTANRGKGTETDGGDDIHNPSGLNIEQTSFGSASRDYVGTSSGSSGHMVWQDNANSSSSLINWGSSCKRKSVEDSSGVLGTGGSSSSLVVSENNSWSTVPASNASSSLSVTTPSEDVRTANPPLHHNPGNGVWQASSEAFPLVSVVGNVERPLRSFGSSVNQVQHRESLPMNSSSTGSARHPNNSSLHQVPGSDSFNDSLELRLTAGITAANSGSPQNQSFSLHVPGFSGSMHPFPWHGAANLRGASQHEELNLRIPPRDNSENHMLVPTSSGHDPANWHVSSGNVNNSGALSSSPWMGSSSSIPSFPNPSWIVTHEVPMQNLHRLSEFSPWSLFPSVAHNGQSSSLPSGHPASSQDTSNHQSFARSTSLMGRRVDDVFSAPNSLRALAFDIEGRRRLINEIRQVLNAMRRGENVQAEDHSHFDPFILQVYGMAELHDRHRDMRLDVDNMSYEELLALEERIGDVNTGLNEDIIMKSMKQRVYESTMSESSSSDLEPCCICQEEYADGDNVGSLDCGHEFHINCIKHWLMQKNLCPICKITALATE